jgi:hypothetical protein
MLDLLLHLGEMLEKTDNNGKDKFDQLYFKFISFRPGSTKKLTEILKIQTGGLGLEAFSLDGRVLRAGVVCRRAHPLFSVCTSRLAHVPGIVLPIFTCNVTPV